MPKPPNSTTPQYPRAQEPWRNAWRTAIAPLLSTPALEALRTALADGDARLIQRATTSPPPLQCVADWPVEGACALGYCGVVELGGFGTATVGETGEFFARLCYEIDRRLGEPAGCRHWINFWDESDLDALRREVIPEVDRSLHERLLSA